MSELPDEVKPELPAVLERTKKRFKEPQLLINEHQDGNKAIGIKIVVESFRFYLYLIFVFLNIVGGILTNLKTESYFGCNKYPELLTSIFGSLNICYIYDFPPATYVLPFIYSFVTLCAYLYAAASIFRAWVAKEENQITQTAFRIYSCAMVYVAISASLFSTIFAVPPNPGEDRWTIHIHTVPYTNLCVALAVLQIAVTWFGIRVAWEHLKAPGWLRLCSLFYASLLQITIASKIILHINALSDIGPCNPGSNWKEKICNATVSDGVLRYISEESEERICGKGYFWDVSHPTAVLWSQITEQLFRITGIACPLIQSGWFWFHRFDTHYLILWVQDNKDVQDKGFTASDGSEKIS